MDVTPLIKSDQQVIQSYAGGRFRISGAVYETAVIVTPEGTEGWAAPAFSALSAEDFQYLAAMAGMLDVVLLGCGPGIGFLPPDIKKELKKQGLHVETMDTGAACRTYNVLMAEGRRVAAALLPA